MSQLGRRGVKTLSRVAGSYLPRPRGLRLASTSTRGTTSMQASTSHADTDRHTHLSEISSPIRTTDRRRRELIDEILRVDHAGEYGAVRIYEGQLAVLGGGSKDKELLNVRSVSNNSSSTRNTKDVIFYSRDRHAAYEAAGGRPPSRRQSLVDRTSSTAHSPVTILECSRILSWSGNCATRSRSSNGVYCCC
eukprot:gb/GECG01006235.1/.p1 GENE.gb/GECG01006235.1/~~gb/GECG01006235.1/.p1  ORF type:complete len:192 (+),score=18.70 gb/GECG01006235.1/:1-576(+)